jgi:hypothetical protein
VPAAVMNMDIPITLFNICKEMQGMMLTYLQLKKKFNPTIFNPYRFLKTYMDF